MSILGVLLVVLVVLILLAVVTNAAKVPEPWRGIVYAVVIVVLLLWVLWSVGLLDPLAARARPFPATAHPR